MYFDFDDKTKEISWNALSPNEALLILEALELGLQKYEEIQKRMITNNSKDTKALIKASNSKHFFQVNIQLLNKLFKNERKINTVHQG